MTKSQLRMTALAVVAIMVSACGGTAASSAPAPTATAAASAASAAPTEDAFTKEWADLIAAAQAEGEVVFIGGPEGSQQDGEWYKDFAAKFGLEATIVGGPTGETTARILAERQQGIYSIDVASLGGTGTQNFLDAGIFDQLDPEIVHPEALDRSTGWLVDHILYTATDAVGICQYIAVQAEPNLITWWYNTDKVTQEEYDSVKSFNDLLDPKFKGRMVVGDVASGESDRDATVMWGQLGKEWWDKLFREMDIAVVPYGGEREFADGLARGDWDIGMFPPGSDSLQEAEEAGLPVKVWEQTMIEGAPRSGIQRLCLVKDRPHPNGAKLFANWALTKEGQESFNKFTGRNDRTALRSDVPQGIITDDIFTRAHDESNPFVDDVNDVWLAQKEEFNQYVEALFKELNIVPGG